MRKLEARQPSLSAAPKHRIGDATPYFAPAANGRDLLLFLCRFEVDRPLRVAVPADASSVELDTISLALAAWEGAGIGVRFDLHSPSLPAQIELRFSPDGIENAGAGVGDTIADCSLDKGFSEPSQSDAVSAHLAFASIELRRVLYDPAGRPAPVTPEQLLGAVIHELGHALGFSGHVVSRDSVMTGAPGEVRRIGARILAGQPLHAPTVAALYGLPNGVVLGRLSVDPLALEPVQRFASLAAQRGLQGPFVRVGDQTARLLWRETGGRAAGSFVARNWRSALDDPSHFKLLPTARAWRVLGDP